MRARSIFLGALLAAALGFSAHAQSNAVNVSGVVDQFAGGRLSIKADDGSLQSFRVSPHLVVAQSKPATLADIKPNDFIASAGIRRRDGKLHSTELRIFPEALRGLGEGQRPMNDAQKQTMTNATVTGTAIVNGSNDLIVKFHGGDSELIVDPGIPVVRLDIVDKNLVKSGARVRVQGLRDAEGQLAMRITLR